MPFRSPNRKPSDMPCITPPPTENPGALPSAHTHNLRTVYNPHKAVVLVDKGRKTPAGRRYYSNANKEPRTVRPKKPL